MLAALAMPVVAIAGTLPDVVIDDTDVYPESVTSTAGGTLYIGSMKGNVYRASPGKASASVWIRKSPDNGIRSILGVLADEASGTLWLCSVPNFFNGESGASALMAFDLKSGAQRGVYAFPPPDSVCNDVAVAPDGSAYASDTSNGRIFKLAPGATVLSLFGADPALVGIDGLAFSAAGVLYANNVRSNQLLRINVSPAGGMRDFTVLQVSESLSGPDGLRPIGGNRFLQAEGPIGRVAIVSIDGDRARLEIVTDELTSSPGATLVGDTIYAIESNIRYLIDPALKGQHPGPFVLHTFPLPADGATGER